MKIRGLIFPDSQLFITKNAKKKRKLAVKAPINIINLSTL